MARLGIVDRRHPPPLPARSSGTGRGRSRLVFPLPGQIQGERGAAVLDAGRQTLDPSPAQCPGEGHRVEPAGHVAAHAVAQVVGQRGLFPLAAFSSARLWCSRSSVRAMKSSSTANATPGSSARSCAPCSRNSPDSPWPGAKRLRRATTSGSRCRPPCSQGVEHGETSWRTASSLLAPAPCWRRADFAGHLATLITLLFLPLGLAGTGPLPEERTQHHPPPGWLTPALQPDVWWCC